MKDNSTPNITRTINPRSFVKEGGFSSISGNETDAPLKKKGNIMDLICEAVEVVGVPRKGASLQAVKKYVLMKCENSDESRVKTMIKKSLKKALDSGVLQKTNSTKNSAGILGSFILAKKKPLKAETKAKPPQKRSHKIALRKTSDETENAYVSDSEITINKGRGPPKKRNLSDTDVEAKKPKNGQIKPKKVNRNPSKNMEPKVQPLKKVKGKNTIKIFKQPKVGNNSRKDVSDSEVEVKKKQRKSFKSYSSDTEVEATKKDPIIATERLKKKETERGTKAPSAAPKKGKKQNPIPAQADKFAKPQKRGKTISDKKPKPDASVTAKTRSRQ